MLTTYEVYAKTTVDYINNVLESTDKYGNPLVRKYDRYNWWIKVISYHKKASKLKNYIAFPTTLESSKLRILEWFTKTAIVKEENPKKPNQFTFFMLTQVSYLMENHHKYVDEFRTPITEGEYMQMNAMYKTKEAKQVRYTFQDIATSTNYKVVEFGNGEVRVTPELPPEQQLIIPDWLEAILPKQTEAEWLEIWKSNPNKYRVRRIHKAKPKFTAVRKQVKQKYIVKTKELSEQLRQANQTIDKLKKQHDKQQTAIAREINSVTRKVINGQLDTTARTASTLNKIAKRINGQTVDTTNPNSKTKLTKTYTPTVTNPTKEQRLERQRQLEQQQQQTNDNSLLADQQIDTLAVSAQQPIERSTNTTASTTPNSTQPQEENMWETYWRNKRR